MKKFIATFLIIMFSPLATLANVEMFGCDNNTKIALSKRSAPIEDELVKSDAFPKMIPTYVRDTSPITDELIQPYEKSGETLKLWVRKTGEAKSELIEDELVTNKFTSKFGGISIIKKRKKSIIEDNFAKNNLANKDLERINPKTKYDFTKAQIPVQMRVIKNLSTKHKILEGDKILFKTVNDVTIGNITLPKGTHVIGRVEILSESDKMGTPANIVISNFQVKDNPDICLYGNVSKTGANRSIWVYPLYQAGNIMFYVAGFIFVPIHGGHAKLSTKDIYTVFYETGAVVKSNERNADDDNINTTNSL